MSYRQYSDRSAGKNNPLRHDAKTSRRQVFPTSEIPHKWAHQTQESARNPTDGTLHAGCHTIPYSELASVARQLGLS